MTVTLDDQKLFFELWYSTSIAAITTRARDYAPDGVPLLDLVDTCVDRDSTPEAELWSLFKKQYSAIRRFVSDGKVDSDSIDSRLRDGCNYLAFIAFYLTHRSSLFHAWRAHWMNQTCSCVYGSLRHPTDINHVLNELSKSGAHDCQRCRTLWWVTRHWPPSPTP